MVFTSFPTAETPRLDSWRTHLATVLNEPSRVASVSRDSDSNATVWHLVSSNNRTIARSATIFGSTDIAREDVRQLIEQADDLQVRLVSATDRTTYGWYGILNGNATITCARWFATERDRRESIELTMASLPIATAGAAARQLSATATGQRG